MKRIKDTNDIEKRISEIWNSQYMEDIPVWVKQRKYMYADPIKADVLITGINPSFRKGDEEQLTKWHGPAKCNFNPKKWKEDKLKQGKKGISWDTYWGPMYKMLCNDNIHLLDRFDYLDIFHFREQDQSKLSKEILKKGKEDNEGGIKFIADELNLTQHIIEDIIQPRLILVKNKESWAYWGKLKDDGLIWMGYEFEKIKDFASGELELYIITGLLNSDKRIAQEFNSENTHLKGCYVLFAKHINQYVSKEKRPTAELLNNILNNIY